MTKRAPRWADTDEEKFWASNTEPLPMPADVEAWAAEQAAETGSWRKLLDWSPHDDDDSPDIEPDRQQEAKDAIYAALWTLPPEQAEALRNIIAKAGPEKTFDKRRRGHHRRIANELCDILDSKGDSMAAKMRAYALLIGVEEETVIKFVMRARRVLGLSKKSRSAAK